MNLGFFTMPIHPLEKDWRRSLKEDREAFLLADELGLTEAYVGEHVTDRAENITSCIAFLAWIAAATKRIKLGTGTINMPNTHPAAVAASVAMLDHMLDGRLIFGISPGGLLSDAELFENLDADRNAMFLEAINRVLDIWAGQPPYNFHGKYWNVSTEKTQIREIGQGFIARPLQQPHPPIVVTAVAPFSKGVTEAAARGWGRALTARPQTAGSSSVRGSGGGATRSALPRPRALTVAPAFGFGRLACPERPRELARGQERVRCQGRPNGEGLRHRSKRPLRLLLSFAFHQAQDERPHRTVQDPS